MKFNFDKARHAKLFGGTINQAQVDSIQAIMSECNQQGMTNHAQAAYTLATPYHECFNPKHPETRLTPIKEFGGDTYLRSKKYYPYYGRGFSGLTWKANYAKEEERLGIPLVKNPDLILDLKTAANSHVYCMINGVYTGRKLSDYITDKKKDYQNARRIINGTDQAARIAGYAILFEYCIEDDENNLVV